MLYNQSVCVDVLKAAGATTHRDIFILAATLIQAAYRGYKLAVILTAKLISPHVLY